MTSAVFLWFFGIHVAQCFENYYWYNNPALDQAPPPRNPFLTYEADDRPSLEKLTGVRYAQPRLLADQPLLPADNRRIGGVVKTNNGFVLPPNDVPASLKTAPSQQRAVKSAPVVVARQFESAADWPTPPPIVGVGADSSRPSLTPNRQGVAADAAAGASRPVLADDSPPPVAAPKDDSFKTATPNADPQAQPPPPRSPFGSANNPSSSAAKLEENAAADDSGFVLPPPIPTDDSGPKKFLSLKESERDLDHFQFKKFPHNRNEDDDGENVQFEALNDEPTYQKSLFSSNKDSSSSSSAQLFGRLLRNRDRFAYLYAHLNDFLRRRKRQSSGATDTAAASQSSVNLPPSSLPGLGPEKPFQPPINQQPVAASSFPNTNGRVVLSNQSGIPDVGERKVLLPSDANNQQNVLMKATGPVNEGKIFLPQHTQAAQQAVALASPQQPALNPSNDQLAAKAAPVQQPQAVDSAGAGRVVLLNTRPINETKSSKKGSSSSSTTTQRPKHKKKKKNNSNKDETNDQAEADRPSSSSNSNNNAKAQQDSHPQGKIYLPKDQPRSGLARKNLA